MVEGGRFDRVWAGLGGAAGGRGVQEGAEVSRPVQYRDFEAREHDLLAKESLMGVLDVNRVVKCIVPIANSVAYRASLDET